jgi:hypothetical protein
MSAVVELAMAEGTDFTACSRCDAVEATREIEGWQLCGRCEPPTAEPDEGVVVAPSGARLQLYKGFYADGKGR